MSVRKKLAPRRSKRSAPLTLSQRVERLEREFLFLNDDQRTTRSASTDDWHPETPEERWTRMRAWVARQIIPTGAGAPKAPSQGQIATL